MSLKEGLDLEFRWVEASEPILPIVEDEEAIRSLAYHPGFQALTNRLRKQKFIIETDLKRNTHKDMRAVEKLQLGIHWLDYLQSEVERAIGRKKEPVQTPVPQSDIEQFKQVLSFIESI